MKRLKRINCLCSLPTASNTVTLAEVSYISEFFLLMLVVLLVMLLIVNTDPRSVFMVLAVYHQ